ncbi:hypothetical protein K431DRAFT_286139 [Polychaeton citri CBS 116435]|uniref:Uncharacterized protein n=1 Tax=Polychaeton citri CBS 116435 TaxID=1314669 RepID=A0A9P4Q6C6_9PEZI|nr:hypothetical protein K431DRAFT_286139 [Polychaeton citri CBS 116435]
MVKDRILTLLIGAGEIWRKASIACLALLASPGAFGPAASHSNPSNRVTGNLCWRSSTAACPDACRQYALVGSVGSALYSEIAKRRGVLFRFPLPFPMPQIPHPLPCLWSVSGPLISVTGIASDRPS